MSTLSGKTALITGGGSGMGRAAALELARLGVRVVIVGRRAEVLAAVAREWTGEPAIETIAADVADRGAVKRAVAEVGDVNILVNSHGVNVVKRSMAEMTGEDWDHVLSVNATGVYNTMAAVLPGMRERQAGLIINISSVAGKRALPIGGVAYSASKFAVAALGTSVGGEERKRGIRVTTIFPGEVNTPILDQRPEPVSDERRAQMLQPQDIGEVIAMLAALPPHVHIPELVIKPLGQPFV